MKYLLDTNIVSDAMNNPDGPVANKLIQMEGKEMFTSIIVAGELKFGVLNRGSKRMARNLDAILGKLEVRPLVAPMEEHYSVARLALERKGRPMGQNDTWIAAQALALDAIVVTDNVKHFSQVPGLKIENWLRDGA